MKFMHVCVIVLMICAYLGIGIFLRPVVNRCKLACPGLTTAALSALVLTGLMYGMLQGAFNG